MLRRLLLIALTLPTSLLAKESRLPVAQDLRSAAKLALAQRQPLVLLVSLPGCPYCELVRRSYLIPYKAEHGLLSWQLDTTDKQSVLIDFVGERTTPAAYLRARRILVTPTVLFLDGHGNEIAARLEGVAVPDFYGAYLDDRLAAAKRRLI